MKKIKDWLKGKLIDDKILLEVHELCVSRFSSELNEKEARNFIREFVFNFFKIKKYDNVYYVKCDDENNSPEIIDSGYLVLHVYEKINGMTATHLIKF